VPEVRHPHGDEETTKGFQRWVVYLAVADKSSMHPYVCTPQHEMGHLLPLFPVARSKGDTSQRTCSICRDDTPWINRSVPLAAPQRVDRNHAWE